MTVTKKVLHFHCLLTIDAKDGGDLCFTYDAEFAGVGDLFDELEAFEE